MAANSTAVHARLHGRVQGVGFRYFLQAHAERLDLSGWVRNVPDDHSVELVAEGPAAAVEEILELAQEGPPGAKVERVDKEWITPQGQRHGFEIRR